MSSVETAIAQKATGRFYGPVVIAAYCVFFIPAGVLLLGLNNLRRGNRGMGIVHVTFAAILITLYSFAVFVGLKISMMWIFGAAAAAFVISYESDQYQRAIRRGGVRARWWPPLLWTVGWFVIMFVLLATFGDVEG